MWIRLQNSGRQPFIFASMVAMLVSLFGGRALLSISMLFFLLITCVHKDIGRQCIRYVKTPWLLGMSLLFLLPFLSGLWSSNIREWSHVIRIKLPLLLLPIAFAGNWQLSKKQWLWIAIIFILLLLSAAGWSTGQYLLHRQAIQAGYLKAKVIPTPLENDHVRFSWLITVGIITCFVSSTAASNKIYKLLAGISAAALVIYLHLLSARTGLLSFYLTVSIYGIWFLVKQKKQIYAVLVFALLAALPLIAWYSLPTFQNRIRYFIYDVSYVKSNTYLPGANDGNRALSLKAGWSILNRHPLGVGAGDVSDSTLHWYQTNIPHMLRTDQLVVPSSEWLIYGAATGWPGLLIFTIVMFAPLCTPLFTNRAAGWAMVLTAAASLLFDIGLEVQYGVFLYAFILLGYGKWREQKQQQT